MTYMTMITEKKVMKQLRTVMDPELGVDIVGLGFIYGVEIKKGSLGLGVKVLMTLTTPGCPFAGLIQKMIMEAVAKLEGVEEERVQVELTFDPPWNSDMINEEVKLELGFL